MLQRHTPTVDDLLADSLIQAVMRADNVEPQALRTLLQATAGRIAAGRERDARRAGGLLPKPPIDRRPTPRASIDMARLKPVRPAEPCGSAICC
jgi:hypothetical protein